MFISLINLYLSSEGNNNLQSTYNQQQTSIEKTKQLLTEDIRQAGYMGCARFTVDFPLIQHIPFTFIPIKIIGQLNQTELIITYMHFPSNTLIKSMPTNKQIILDKAVVIKPKAILMLSDCESAEIFVADKVNIQSTQQVIETQMNLVKRFNKGAELSTIEQNHYRLEWQSKQEPIFNLVKQTQSGNKQIILHGLRKWSIKPVLIEKRGMLQGLSMNLISKSKFSGQTNNFLIWFNNN